MKRKEIVERIAEEKAIPHRKAGDWLDAFLHELIQQLKGDPDPPPQIREAPEQPQRAKGRRG